MKKQYIIAAGLCAAVIALGLIAATLVWIKPADKSSIGAVGEINITPPDAENIELYPNAKDVDHNNPWNDDTRWTNYKVAATVEQVWAFYEAQLPRQEWTLDWENRPYNTRAYKWSDNNGALPWTLELSIRVIELRGSAVPAADIGLTAISVGLDRVPVRSLESVPTYPGARQVIGSNIYSSYQANATIAEITAFYKTNLTQFGWNFLEESGDGTSMRLRFGWVKGNDHSMRFAGINIVLKQDSGGMTIVEMKLHKS